VIDLQVISKYKHYFQNIQNDVILMKIFGKVNLLDCFFTSIFFVAKSGAQLRV